MANLSSNILKAMALDKILEAYFENDSTKGKEFFFCEIEEKMRIKDFLGREEHLVRKNISASLNRIGKRRLVNFTNNGFIIKDYPVFNSEILTIVKNKSILTFNGCPTLKYDCVTKSYNIPLEEILFINSFPYHKKLLESLKDLNEWIFNYCHYINELEEIAYRIKKDKLFSERVKSMPKGLYQAMQEKGIKELTSSFLEDYIYKMEFGKYFKFIEPFYKRCQVAVDLFLEDYSAKDLYTLANNSLLDGDLCMLRDQIRNFLGAYRFIKEEYGRSIALDLNRGIRYHREKIENLLSSFKDKALSTQLQKLNFLNEKTIAEDYIIVVPQGIEDLIKEGEMQNNCVGHYYNDSIIHGENLIYFLRKKDSPQKSYITCRFNIKDQSTIESRYKNNVSTTFADLHMINYIDEIIRKQLF